MDPTDVLRFTRENGIGTEAAGVQTMPPQPAAPPSRQTLVDMYRIWPRVRPDEKTPGLDVTTPRPSVTARLLWDHMFVPTIAA